MMTDLLQRTGNNSIGPAGLHGLPVALVIAVDAVNGDQYGIFPDIEAATEWAGKQSLPCVVVYPMIIGEPDFGNAVQQ
jgi:hypothetical protein